LVLCRNYIPFKNLRLKKTAFNRLSFLVNGLTVLCRLASVCGANVYARATILTFNRIDHIQAFAGSNGAFGAFGFTSTTADAITGDDVGHDIYPFMSSLEMIRAKNSTAILHRQ
jgi:hypothetical protein